MQHYLFFILKKASWPCLVLAGLAARGQQAPSPPPLAPAHHPWRWVPSIALDNRNPLSADAAVRVIGLNVGAMPRGKPYRVGLTAYTLRRDYTQLYTYSGKGKSQKIKDTYSPALNLFYFTPNFSYTFLRSRFLELSVPVDVGLGRSHYTVTNEKNQVITDTKGLFVPAEIGLGVLVRPTRWVGLSGGIGYRVSLTDMAFEDDFNGWYYSYRLSLFVGPIWQDVRAHCRSQLAWRRAHRLPPGAELPQEDANP